MSRHKFNTCDMDKNLISFEIPQAQLDEIFSWINSLKSSLSEHLVTLEKKDRLRIVKMHDQNASFIEKSLESMKQNEELTPKFIDVTEMEKDLNAVKILRRMLEPLNQLVSDMEDSITLAGSEALTAALAYYQSLKVNVRMNVSGAETSFEELKKQFAKHGVKKNKEE
ncbi:MAG: hypothetical protein GY756_28330 [bacterium]|nr:hypothetical protein [bacterium]